MGLCKIQGSHNSDYEEFYHNKLRGLSPQANYTDRETAAGRRSANFCGCRVVSTTDTNGLILGFLYRSHYYFFQVAPQLYSWGWVNPVPHPLLLRKSGSAGNRTQNLWTCSQELWPLDHRGGLHCCIVWRNTPLPPSALLLTRLRMVYSSHLSYVVLHPRKQNYASWLSAAQNLHGLAISHKCSLAFVGIVRRFEYSNK
jgi:hypothetical protein